MEIDLNADVGEGYGAWRMGDDEALIRHLSSVNIACGYHAGDAEIMSRTVASALAAGADIGAHVGLPDLIGFGRREMKIDGASFTSHIFYQLGALQAIAAAAGARVTHMSLHGALGNMAAANLDLAMQLMGAVATFDPAIVVSTSPGTMTMQAAHRHGLRTVGIFAADRAYRADGGLVGRNVAGSVIGDPEAVARRVVRLLDDGRVDTIDGQRIEMPAATVMVHGDTPGAAAAAAAIRRAVEEAGGSVLPVSRLAAARQER